MPDLEYLVLADYVRQDAGATHIMGAGIDTFGIPGPSVACGYTRRRGRPYLIQHQG